MCCLGYEMEHYTEAAKQLPKVGSEVGTPDGKAIVVALNMLKMDVRVKQDDGAGGWIYKEFPASELKFKKPIAPKVEEDDEKEEIEE